MRRRRREARGCRVHAGALANRYLLRRRVSLFVFPSLMCFDPSGGICTLWYLPRPSRALFSCRGSSGPLLIHASQAIMLNYLLLSFLIGTAIQLTPSGSNPAKTRRGGVGAQLLGGWIKIPQGEKQPGTGFLWVGLCETPQSPTRDPLAPRQGTGTPQGTPGVGGLRSIAGGRAEWGQRLPNCTQSRGFASPGL